MYPIAKLFEYLAVGKLTIKFGRKEDEANKKMNEYREDMFMDADEISGNMLEGILADREYKCFSDKFTRATQAKEIVALMRV